MSTCAARWLRWGALLTISLVASVPETGALTTSWTSFPDLVRLAEQIVEGRISAIGEGLNPAGMPVTLLTVSVADSLKGAVVTTATVELLGGRTGDLELRVAGMPQFRVGDRVLLFLAENGTAVCPLVGCGQGYFRVKPSAAGEDPVVEQYPSDGVVGRRSRPSIAEVPWVDGTTTLRDFKTMIRTEIQQSGAVSGTR